jgi:hypothetical protein
MINMKNLILLLVLSTSLVSCHAGGLVAIPFLVAVFGLYFLGVAYRKSKSGSTQQTPGGIVESDKNVSIFKIGQLWYAVALILAAIVIALIMESDYRPYDPKKDGVPKEKVDDGRESAEDQLKKAK